MPLFYKGAGPGTYWHNHDARLTGFAPQAPGIAPGVVRVVGHIANGSTHSPYVSLTKSFGIAWDYAVYCGRRRPVATAADPGFVYEVDLADPLPRGMQLLDPMQVVTGAFANPLAVAPYQHNGASRFVLGVIDPLRMRHLLAVPSRQPPRRVGSLTRPTSRTN
jgi:hypothetical protein